MSAMKMDVWKYYGVTHQDHDLCNPMHPRKMDQLLAVLKLESGAHVVDIACGKAELLFLLHERYGIRGCGVDISPYFLAEAVDRKRLRAPDAEIELVESAGADWRPDGQEFCDCACCVGAEWVFGGYRNTLETLKGWARPGGWILSSVPFWRCPPTPEYLEASGLSADAYKLHSENVAMGEELGLSLCYTLVANQDDWDHYHGLIWQAVNAYAREHPDDSDLEEIQAETARQREFYLRWERECLGWAIYALRK